MSPLYIPPVSPLYLAGGAQAAHSFVSDGWLLPMTDAAADLLQASRDAAAARLQATAGAAATAVTAGGLLTLTPNPSPNPNPNLTPQNPGL